MRTRSSQWNAGAAAAPLGHRAVDEPARDVELGGQEVRRVHEALLLAHEAALLEEGHDAVGDRAGVALHQTGRGWGRRSAPTGAGAAAADELAEAVGGRARRARRGCRGRPAGPRPRPVHPVHAEPHRRANGALRETEVRQRPGLVAAPRRVAPRANRHVARLGGIRGHGDDARARDGELLPAAARGGAARRRARPPRGQAGWRRRHSASRGARPRAREGRRWHRRGRALPRRRRPGRSAGRRRRRPAPSPRGRARRARRPRSGRPVRRPGRAPRRARPRTREGPP